MRKLNAAEVRALKWAMEQQQSDYCRFQIEALYLDGFEDEPGNCQKFDRQKRERWTDHGRWPSDMGTAALSGQSWKSSPYTVRDRKHTMPGDVLYFINGHGPDGHVVTRVYGNIVSENSIVHASRGDGRWFRPLADFGTPDVVLRFPWVYKMRDTKRLGKQTAPKVWRPSVAEMSRAQLKLR